MSNHDLHELMLLYVIDGLEPDERAEMQRLLDAGDAAAQRAYAEAAETLSRLPEALDPVAPRPEVLEGLLERVKGNEMTRGEGQAQAGTPDPIGPWPKLAIAAAFVLGVGLAGIVMWQVLQPQNGNQTVTADDWADIEKLVAQQKQALAEQQSELSELESQLAGIKDATQIEALEKVIEGQRLAIVEQRQRIGELQESMSLLVGPGVQQAELAGADELPNAQGRLMWDPTTGQMRLLTRGLEPLKPGQTYQLWFVTEDGNTVSLGIFEVGEVAATTAAYINTAPLVPDNVNVAAISIEPAGGSPEAGPTGPIIMTGPPKGE